jgi:hypothetical protein
MQIPIDPNKTYPVVIKVNGVVRIREMKGMYLLDPTNPESNRYRIEYDIRYCR